MALLFVYVILVQSEERRGTPTTILRMVPRPRTVRGRTDSTRSVIPLSSVVCRLSSVLFLTPNT